MTVLGTVRAVSDGKSIIWRAISDTDIIFNRREIQKVINIPGHFMVIHVRDCWEVHAWVHNIIWSDRGGHELLRQRERKHVHLG